MIDREEDENYAECQIDLEVPTGLEDSTDNEYFSPTELRDILLKLSSGLEWTKARTSNWRYSPKQRKVQFHYELWDNDYQSPKELSERLEELGISSIFQGLYEATIGLKRDGTFDRILNIRNIDKPEDSRLVDALLGE